VNICKNIAKKRKVAHSLLQEKQVLCDSTSGVVVFHVLQRMTVDMSNTAISLE